MDNKATVEFVCPIMNNYASMDLGGVVYSAFSICINLHIFASRIQPLSQGSLLLVLGNEAGPHPLGDLELWEDLPGLVGKTMNKQN